MPSDPLQILGDRFRAAIVAAFPGLDPAAADPQISPSRNPKFGDYQSNAAMGLAKTLGGQPREVAQRIVERLDVSDIAEPVTQASIAGPGFINVTLRAEALAGLLGEMDTARLGIEPTSPPETVVVDLMGVNLAKQVQVWHLRSTVIGDAIARTFERLGDRVIRQNHLGDWGLQIAMVTAKLIELERQGRVSFDRLTLDDLDAMYKLAQAEGDADEAGLEAARRWNMGPKVLAEMAAQVSGAREAMEAAKRTLVALQSGDPATVAAWERISRITLDACLAVCARLKANVTVEHSAGESSYRHELAGVVADLEKRGIATESEGALVVQLEGLADPLLVRKSDGGFIYATTDLAAIRRRVQRLSADRVIYVVDARQSLHFQQVFAAAIKAGYARNPRTGKTAELRHAAFGTMLGEDGRPYKSRSGESVKLTDMLDEAIARAGAAVAAKSPELPERERAEIAGRVAIAAIKYADLSTERTKDYVFSYDRMMSFEGNTGPYLLYALVRIKSIFRKAAERLGEEAIGRARSGGAGPFRLGMAEEKTLALAILRYPGVVDTVAESLEPHRLCQYLYDLAGSFSAFFQQCPVIQAPDDETRWARLRLCGLTDRVLSDGLSLLGIEPLERM